MSFVEIDGMYFEDDPGEYKRSQLITVTGLTRCVDNLPYIKKWSLYRKKDDGTYDPVDLTDNPTSDRNQLVIQPNSLEYGYYKIIYEIVVTLADGSTRNPKEKTFIKLIETGIAVYGLEFGTNNLKIGYAQDITFQPNKFSFDFDYLADIPSLQFKFYCRKVQKSGKVLLDNLDFGPELKTAQTSGYNFKQADSPCFQSTGSQN